MLVAQNGSGLIKIASELFRERCSLFAHRSKKYCLAIRVGSIRENDRDPLAGFAAQMSKRFFDERDLQPLEGLEARAVAALQRLTVWIALGTGARVQEEECHRYRHDDRADYPKPI